MGLRGPAPKSGRRYADRDVIVRAGGLPYVLWPTINVDGELVRHPLATHRGYVPVLRLAASESGLGRDGKGHRTRWLSRGQGVRPRDGDSWNWHPSNLQVFALADSLPKAVRSAKQSRLR